MAKENKMNLLKEAEIEVVTTYLSRILGIGFYWIKRASRAGQ